LLAVENFPRNFTALFLGFSNLVFGYPDLRGLGIMSCLTFLVLIATSIFRIREFYQINGSRIFFAWLCWGLASIVTYLIILWMPFGSFANPGALRLYAPLAIVLTLQLAFLYFKVSQLWVRAPQFLRAIRILCPLLFAFAIGRAFFTIDAERTFTDYGAFHQDRAVRKFLQEHLETSTLVVANESVQSLVLGVSAIDFLSARNNRELIFRAQSTGVIQKIFIVQSLDRNHMPLPNQDLTWEQTTLLKLPVSSRTVLRISQPRFD
jgi:hypothetical protein